jgi:hypothetical protein
MNEFLIKLPRMYKAVAAFCALLVPFLTSVGTALSDGGVTSSEWVTIATAGTALIAGTKAVYEIRNKEVK